MYRNRPKGNYIQESTWQELYVLTQHWKSDLEFYRDDLHFLKNLIAKYFIWITKPENVAAVNDIEVALLKIEQSCTDLFDKTTKHLEQLGSLSDDPKIEIARIFRIEHEHLEDSIAAFVKAFRKHRKDVFKITEYVADNEQLTKAFDP